PRRSSDLLDVVLDGMLANPVREVVVRDPGLALRAPELGRPREHAEVLVQPFVRAALDRLLRVVLEVVEDRDGRVAGALGGFGTEDRKSTRVVREQVVVGLPRVWAQVHAAERVVRDVAGDV